MAAENVGAAVKVGAAVDPVKFPNTVFAAAVLSVKVVEGVEDGFAVEAVKSGLRLPIVTLVTEPEPEDPPHGTAVVVKRPPVPACTQFPFVKAESVRLVAVCAPDVIVPTTIFGVPVKPPDVPVVL